MSHRGWGLGLPGEAPGVCLHGVPVSQVVRAAHLLRHLLRHPPHRFITQYVDSSVGADALNVGELWTDLHWCGGRGHRAARARMAVHLKLAGRVSLPCASGASGAVQSSLGGSLT